MTVRSGDDPEADLEKRPTPSKRRAEGGGISGPRLDAAARSASHLRVAGSSPEIDPFASQVPAIPAAAELIALARGSVDIVVRTIEAARNEPSRPVADLRLAVLRSTGDAVTVADALNKAEDELLRLRGDVSSAQAPAHAQRERRVEVLRAELERKTVELERQRRTVAARAATAAKGSADERVLITYNAEIERAVIVLDAFKARQELRRATGRPFDSALAGIDGEVDATRSYTTLLRRTRGDLDAASSAVMPRRRIALVDQGTQQLAGFETHSTRLRTFVEGGERYVRTMTALGARLEALPPGLDRRGAGTAAVRVADAPILSLTQEIAGESAALPRRASAWRHAVAVTDEFARNELGACRQSVSRGRTRHGDLERELAPMIKKAGELGSARADAQLSGDAAKIRAAEAAIAKFHSECGERWKRLSRAERDERQSVLSASVTAGASAQVGRSPDVLLDYLATARGLRGIELIDALASKRFTETELTALRRRFAERNPGSPAVTFDAWVEARLGSDIERDAWALAKRSDYTAYLRFRAPLEATRSASDGAPFSVLIDALRTEERSTIARAHPEVARVCPEKFREGAVLKELFECVPAASIFTRRELQWLRGFTAADECRQRLMCRFVASRLEEAARDQQIVGSPFPSEQFVTYAEKLLRATSRDPAASARALRECALMAHERTNDDRTLAAQLTSFLDLARRELVTAENGGTLADVRPVPLGLRLELFQFEETGDTRGGSVYEMPEAARTELFDVTRRRLVRALGRELTRAESALVREALRAAETDWVAIAGERFPRFSTDANDALLARLGTIRTTNSGALLEALAELDEVFATVRTEVRYGVFSSRRLAEIDAEAENEGKGASYVRRTTPGFGVVDGVLTREEAARRERELVDRAVILAECTARAQAPYDLKREEVARLEEQRRTARAEGEDERTRGLTTELERAQQELTELKRDLDAATAEEARFRRMQDETIRRIERVLPRFTERLETRASEAAHAELVRCADSADAKRRLWAEEDRVETAKRRAEFTERALETHRRLGQLDRLATGLDAHVREESDPRARTVYAELLRNAREEHAAEVASFRRYLNGARARRCLADDADCRNLIATRRDGALHPELTRAMARGAAQVGPVLDAIADLHARPGDAKAILDGLASSGPTASLFRLAEIRFRETHAGSTLEELLLQRLPAARWKTAAEIEALRTSGEFKTIQARMTLLRDGKVTEYFTERALELRAGKGLTQGEDALAILRIAELDNPCLKRALVSALRERGHSVAVDSTAGLETWLFHGAKGAWEERVEARIAERKRRGAYGASPYDAYISSTHWHYDLAWCKPELDYLERYLQGRREGDAARVAAARLRLELMAPNPNPEAALRLVCAPLRSGETIRHPAYVERQREWIEALVAADITVNGNSRLIEQVRDSRLPLGIRLQVEAYLRNELGTVEREATHDSATAARRDVREIQVLCRKTAVDHARARGELEALRDRETDDAKKRALQARIGEEIARFDRFKRSDFARPFFEDRRNRIWSEDFTRLTGAARGAHPLAASYDIGRGLVEKTRDDVRALIELMTSRRLAPRDVADAVGQRCVTPEAGAYYASVYREQYREDICYLAARRHLGERAWGALSDVQKRAWLAEHQELRVLGVAIERGVRGDAVGYLAARTEYELASAPAGRGRAAFEALTKLYQGEPGARLEQVMERMRRDGKSFDALWLECSRRDTNYAGDVTVNDIALWFKARADGRSERAEAVELRFLHNALHGGTDGRHLDAQGLITFLTRDGFGPEAAARVRRLRLEYQNLYGIDPLEMVRRNHAERLATVGLNDAKAVMALLAGDMAVARRESVRRCFWLDFETRRGSTYNLVKFEELNRLARHIGRAGLAEIRQEIDREIERRPELRERGIRTLAGYIGAVSLRDTADSDVKTVNAVFDGRNGGIDQGTLKLFVMRRDALLRALWIADQQREQVAARALGFKSTARGARNSLRNAEEEYDNRHWTGGPLHIFTGYGNTLYEQRERAARSASQAGRAERALERCLREYDGTVFESVGSNGQFRLSADAGQAARGDRAKIARLGRESLDLTIEGKFEEARTKFTESTDVMKRHVTLDGDGMLGQSRIIDVWFTDASSYFRRNARDLERVMKDCDVLEERLRIARTALLVTAVVLTTGGLGAPALVSTLIFAPVAIGSHFLEAEVSAQMGFSDRKSGYDRAGWNALEDIGYMFDAANITEDLGGMLGLGPTSPQGAIKKAVKDLQQLGPDRIAKNLHSGGPGGSSLLALRRLVWNAPKEESAPPPERSGSRQREYTDAEVPDDPERRNELDLRDLVLDDDERKRRARRPDEETSLPEPLTAGELKALLDAITPLVEGARALNVDLAPLKELLERMRSEAPPGENGDPGEPLEPRALLELLARLRGTPEVGALASSLEPMLALLSVVALVGPSAPQAADDGDADGDDDGEGGGDGYAAPDEDDEGPDEDDDMDSDDDGEEADPVPSPPPPGRPPPGRDTPPEPPTDAPRDTLSPPPPHNRTPEAYVKPESARADKEPSSPRRDPVPLLPGSGPRGTDLAPDPAPRHVPRHREQSEPLGAKGTEPGNGTNESGDKKAQSSFDPFKRADSPTPKEHDKVTPFDPRREWAITRAVQLLLPFGLDWPTEQIEQLIDDHLRKSAGAKRTEKSDPFSATVFLQPPTEPGKPPPPVNPFGFPEPPASPPPPSPPMSPPAGVAGAGGGTMPEAPADPSVPASKRGARGKGGDKHVAESFRRFLHAMFGASGSESVVGAPLVTPPFGFSVPHAGTNISETNRRADSSRGVSVHFDSIPLAPARTTRVPSDAADRSLKGREPHRSGLLAEVSFMAPETHGDGFVRRAANAVSNVRALVSEELGAIAASGGEKSEGASNRISLDSDRQHLLVVQSILRAADLALQRTDGLPDGAKCADALVVVAGQLGRAAERLSRVESFSGATEQVSDLRRDIGLALSERTSGTIGRSAQTRTVSLEASLAYAQSKEAAASPTSAASLPDFIDSARREHAAARTSGRASERTVMLDEAAVSYTDEVRLTLTDLIGEPSRAQLACYAAIPPNRRGACLRELALLPADAGRFSDSLSGLLGKLTAPQSDHFRALPLSEREAAVARLASLDGGEVTVRSVEASRESLGDSARSGDNMGTGAVRTLRGLESAVGELRTALDAVEELARASAPRDGVSVRDIAPALEGRAHSRQLLSSRRVTSAIVMLEELRLELRAGGMFAEPLRRVDRALAQFEVSAESGVHGSDGNARYLGMALLDGIRTCRRLVLERARALEVVVDLPSLRLHRQHVDAALDELETCREQIAAALRLPNLPEPFRSRLLASAAETDGALVLAQTGLIHSGFIEPLFEWTRARNADGHRKPGPGFRGLEEPQVDRSSLAAISVAVARSIETCAAARSFADARGAGMGVRSGVEALLRECERILYSGAVHDPVLRAELMRAVEEARQILARLEGVGSRVYDQELRMCQILASPRLDDLRCFIAETPLSSYVQSLMNEARVRVEIARSRPVEAVPGDGGANGSWPSAPLRARRNRRKVKVTLDPRKVRALLDANPMLLTERVYRELYSIMSQHEDDERVGWLRRIRGRTLDERMLRALRRLKSRRKSLRSAAESAAAARARARTRGEELARVSNARSGRELDTQSAHQSDRPGAKRKSWRVRRLRDLHLRAAVERRFKRC